MTDESARLDEVVRDLLDKGGSKPERVLLLRELVRRGSELPDGMLDSALQRLMERIID